jgi:ElaA protein
MNTNTNLRWVTKAFAELTVDELYDVLRLRSEVFVVEQKCIFLDIDNNDRKAFHTIGFIGDEVVATTRLFEKDIMYDGYQSIGRVVSASKHRGLGIGKALMQYSISECERLFGKGPIKIGAQLYLKKFYSEQGFEQSGDVYLEDDIDHIPMIRAEK